MVLVAKNLPANAGEVRDVGSIPGLGRSLGEGMATHSVFLPGALAPHERLPEILVVPREKTPTGAAARGNP